MHFPIYEFTTPKLKSSVRAHDYLVQFLASNRDHKAQNRASWREPSSEVCPLAPGKLRDTGSEYGGSVFTLHSYFI